MGWAQEQQGPEGRGQGTARRGRRERCRVQGYRAWPGPVGKELQCVNRRLAGEDPLCDAIMRAVRDGLVWVGGCDETDESKMGSSHMQLQDRGYARAHEYSDLSTTARGRSRARARARQRRVLSRRFTAVGARLLELATLHWPSGATIP